MDSTCSYMGRSFQLTVTTQLPTFVALKARNTPPSSWGLRGLHPLKISAAPPASTLAGGSSLAFLPLHSLLCAAARGLFLKGKVDLVPALSKFFHEWRQAQ